MNNSIHTLHPWHGVSINKNNPTIVTAYIEITPFDSVKYEVDKESGILKVDRPQKFSNHCPALYGFIPKTYCSKNVAKIFHNHTVSDGDKDPLDICVLTEKPISVNNILVNAVVIGGLRLIDNEEADDKIIAVLYNDLIYGDYTSINQLPLSVLNRLKHYFLTYKALPNELNTIQITEMYDRDKAQEVVIASMLDYTQLITK